MGLNISMHVIKQREGYGEVGRNPKGTREEIEADLSRFLHDKFPLGGFSCVFVSEGSTIVDQKASYDFSVDMGHYGAEFEANGYEMLQMWLALAEYCFRNFLKWLTRARRKEHVNEHKARDYPRNPT